MNKEKAIIEEIANDLLLSGKPEARLEIRDEGGNNYFVQLKSSFELEDSSKEELTHEKAEHIFNKLGLRGQTDLDLGFFVLSVEDDVNKTNTLKKKGDTLRIGLIIEKSFNHYKDNGYNEEEDKRVLLEETKAIFEKISNEYLNHRNKITSFIKNHHK